MRKKVLVLTLVSLVVLMLFVPGCVGMLARTDVLIPAMQDTWPNIRADAEKGGAPVAVLEEFDLALANKDSVLIVNRWPIIETAVLEHIKTLSPGLAASKTERLKNFSEAVNKLVRLPY